MKINRFLELDRPRSDAEVRVIEGTIQRINYQKKELSVIADGQIWHVALDPNCELRFNNEKAILRCFHPLDQVRIQFTGAEPRHRMIGMYGWERITQVV